MFRYCLILLAISVISCSSSADESISTDATTDSSVVEVDSLLGLLPDYCNESILVGAERFDQYISGLKGKRVAIVANQSSMIGDIHLVDTLLAQGVVVVKVFSPEHGFRGRADAGEEVDSEIDEKTGLPIISLYRKIKRPTDRELADVDVILFDIQDVGARFYTYISTMTLLMEAAAENQKELIILDRPNPNGHYVGGPVLNPRYSSFVGMHEVPVVHGMTIGEYAKMVDGEKWISSEMGDKLSVVGCKDWDHTKFYELPIPPSPNLPNMASVYLYPSLCLFEGSIVSIGRGTNQPFQCVGHPDFEVNILEDLYSFTPLPNEGSKHPKLEGENCYGYNFEKMTLDEYRSFHFDIQYLLEFYTKLDKKKHFFLSTGFINNLAGDRSFKDAIIAGKNQQEIEESWSQDLEEFNKIRAKYLLYPDF